MPATKIKFRSAYSEPIRKNCPAGEEEYPVWEYEINARGQKKLTITGTRNRFEEIQESLEDTLIENILRRVAVGDMSDFRPDGIYQDISEIPNNLIQARQEMQKIENLWKDLPNDIKAKYNWSVDEYMAEAGTEAWLVDTGFINPTVTEETTTSKALKETTTSKALKETTTAEVPENE